jgi:glycosyltransferase involved in cell wall biosynthesis
LIYIGSIINRRNIPSLLRAFKDVIITIKCQLLLVGTNLMVPKRDIRKLINELGLSSYVIWIEHVPEEDIVQLYCGAESLILLSSYEGFGLPIIEAMACGIPVIASKIEPFLALAQDSALFVDNISVNNIYKAISFMLTDRDIKAQLIEKGLKRANHFSWRETAEKTLDIFKKAVRNKT